MDITFKLHQNGTIATREDRVGQNAFNSDVYEALKALARNPKDAYDLWLEIPGNEGRTMQEFFDSLGVKTDSIRPEDTTFVTLGTNLFNRLTVTSGGYYTASGYWATDSHFKSSDLILVSPGETYTFSSPTVTGHLTFWNEDGLFVAGLTAGSYSQTFTTPVNSSIKYMRFPVSINEDLTKLMLVKGNKIPSTYEPYTLRFSDDVALSDKQLEDFLTTESIEIAPSKNLFNYNSMIQYGKEVGTNGTLRDAPNSAVLVSLPIDSSKGALTLSGLPTYATGYNRIYSFEDSNKAPLKTSLGASDSIYRLNSSGTISIPSNAKYVSINLHANKTSSEVMDYSKTQIEYSSSPSSFEPYASTIKSIAGYSVGGGGDSSIASNPFGGVDLLVFGDSTATTSTQNDDGSNYVEGTRQNWPTWLLQEYPTKSFVNMSMPGAAWKDRSGVLPQQMISTQINNAIARGHKADVICIAMGTNDGNTNLGDFNTAMSKKTLGDLDRTKLYEALRWALWTIQSQPQWDSAVKFVALPIQRADYEPVQSLHTAITTMAKRYGFIVVDMNTESQIIREFEVWGAEGRDLYDGLHPNVKGQKKMAEVWKRHILNAIK